MSASRRQPADQYDQLPNLPSDASVEARSSDESVETAGKLARRLSSRDVVHRVSSV
jgi:hypothetical protein